MLKRVVGASPEKPLPKALWPLMIGVTAITGILAVAALVTESDSKPAPQNADVISAIEHHFGVTYRGDNPSDANPYRPSGKTRAESWDISPRYTLDTSDHRVLSDCFTENTSPTHDHLDITVTCGETPLARVR